MSKTMEMKTTKLGLARLHEGLSGTMILRTQTWTHFLIGLSSMQNAPGKHIFYIMHPTVMPWI